MTFDDRVEFACRDGLVLAQPSMKVLVSNDHAFQMHAVLR